MGKTNKADRLDSRIIQAIRHGTLEDVKSVVQNATAIFQQDRELLADALYTSCKTDQLKIVNYLLKYGADANVRVDHRQTPLMVARSKAVAEALVAMGAELDAVDEAEMTALMQTKSVEVAEFLIEQQASLDKVNKQGNTALMNMLLEEKASQRESCVKIANLLIDGGADVNAADLEGRTVLITAVWKGHTHIVQRLVDKGVEVNKLDVRGRNVLHHLCEDPKRALRYQAGDKSLDDHNTIKILLGTSADINLKEHIEGKTPLHCALLSKNDLLVDALLDNNPPADVNVQDYRGRTALHMAAENGQHELVKKLMRYGADALVKSADGWTPLHFGAGSIRHSADTVRALLDNVTDVNVTTNLGKTALHLAAEAGNIEVVRHLLNLRTGAVNVAKRDVHGNSALVCAAKAAHKAIVRILAPYSAPALDAIAKKAAEEMRASVIDFDSQGKNGLHLTPRRVFDLIYGSPRISIEQTTMDETPDLGTDSRQKSQTSKAFRWIHLPANNVFWCRGLLIKLLLEENGIDGETFQALLKSFDHRHKGKHLHAQYMRPTCQYTPRNAKAAEHVRQQLDPQNKHTKTSDVIDMDNAMVQHGSHSSERRASSHKSTPSKKRGRGLEGSFDSVPTTAGPVEDLAQDDTPRESFSVDDDVTLVPDSMYVFMPYLHFERFKDRNKMDSAVRRVQGELSAHRTTKVAAKYATDIVLQAPWISINRRMIADEKLIHAHATPENATLQIRRTLDQFFYRTIDTRERDKDQVVHRHQKRFPESDEKGRDANILMVDQLWMWIVNENLVITSFPRRWGRDNDEDGVWESIYRDVQSTTRNHISDVYELAMIIAGHCFGWVDRRESWHQDTLFLDMFESSIGHAMNDEVRLFKAFQKATREASSWLRKIRGYPVDTAAYDNVPEHLHIQTTEDDEDNEGHFAETPGSQPVFVQTLLDIGEETHLLEEVKDIRDELEMLRMIFDTQKELVPDIQKHILTIMEQHKNTGARQARIKQLHEDQMRYILNPLRDIERMDRQAKRIYDSIRDLLDLKQVRSSHITNL